MEEMLPTTLTKQYVEQWYKEDRLQATKSVVEASIVMAIPTLVLIAYIDHFDFWPIIALIIATFLSSLTMLGLACTSYKQYKVGKQW